MNIKEVIVVEGQNDANVLKSYFECDTIVTNGTHLSKEIIALIRETKEKRGIIVFTDPDYPGESIRKRINEAIPGCKQAFVEREKAQTTKKVGVEHADRATLEDALQHLMTYEESPETISKALFLSLGLSGKKNSGELRGKIAKHYHLGKPNGKTLWKRLNMLGITYEEVKELMETL